MALPFEADEYFYSRQRYNQLLEIRDTDETILDHSGETRFSGEKKFGTVGAVALDRNGNLAAGTSTGGMTNKRPGRLGDSPIIGAGTYADNEACGVSCTGHGEFFIRYAVAHDIVALVKDKSFSVQEGAD